MDWLLELNRNPTTRAVIKGLGLPIPQPPVLRRDKKPWRQRFLDDEKVVVASWSGGELVTALAPTLAAAGARVVLASEHLAAEPFATAAQAWSEPVEQRLEPAPEERVFSLVLDTSSFTSLDHIDSLYEVCHRWLPALQRTGRVVLLSRPPDPSNPERAAAQQAVEGFARSLAKELGRKGTTTNWLRVARGAEDRLAGPLRYLLSRYSSFVTAQPLDVTSTARSNAMSNDPWSAALTGKTCLVTGASRGIGKATAAALAREGARPILVDLPGTESALSQLAQEHQGTALYLDIHADDAIATLRELLEPQGGVDIVIHNAGVTRDKTLARMTREQWDLVLSINLKAAVRITQKLLEASLIRDEGRLLFLASVTGIAGNAGQTNYAASKAGLIGFVRAVANQVKDRGITANAVAPGLIETKMIAHMPIAIREAARRLSALGQGGLPADVAEALTFFSLPTSHGITGSVLRVCGGALVGA